MTRIVAVFGVALPLLGGCTGIVSLPPGGSEGPGPSGLAPGSSSTPGATGTAGRAASSSPEPAMGFAVPTDQPVLLPFETRLDKLAAVLAVPVNDPVFDVARQNATRLGAYDFANGVVPDSTWTALRISLWVQALKPVCASPAMAARYPNLAQDASPLIEAAYGRAMTDEDRADIQAAAQGSALSPEQLSRTLCVTLLSSAELVIL